MFWGDENIRKIRTTRFRGRVFAADQYRRYFRNQPAPQFPRFAPFFRANRRSASLEKER
jgi:hypothetical protein